MVYRAGLGTPKFWNGNSVACCHLLFHLSFCLCQIPSSFREAPSFFVGLTSEEACFQPEISKPFLCLVKNWKPQYWLHATWGFTCLWNPSAIIFTKTCSRAVQIMFHLFFTALCDCYGAGTFTHYSPSWYCICFCTGQAYLSPSEQTACLARGWRRHMNSSGRNTPISFLTWATGQWASSLRISCWGSQVSRYHALYLHRMHKMTETISLFQIALGITLAGRFFFWTLLPVFRRYCWFIDSFSSCLWSFCLS